MKRILFLLLMVVFVISMIAVGTGCKAATTETTAAATTAAATTAAETTALVDYGVKAPVKGNGELVYLLMPMYNNAAWAAYPAMMEGLCKEYNYNLKVLNANQKAQEQVNQFTTMLTEKPSAVIAIPVDGTAIIASINEVRAAGIPVMISNVPVIDTYSDYSSFLEPVQIGAEGAQKVVDALTKKYGEPKGVVYALWGDEKNNWCLLIVQGWESVMKNYPNIKVIAKFTPNWDMGETVTITEDVFTANKDIDVMFYLGDFRAGSFPPILESHGYKKGDILQIATDGDPAALEMIKQGWLSETCSLAMYHQMYANMCFLNDVISKKPINPGLYTIDPPDYPAIVGTLVLETYAPTLHLKSTWITVKDVNDPTLWGNQVAK